MPCASEEMSANCFSESIYGGRCVAPRDLRGFATQDRRKSGLSWRFGVFRGAFEDGTHFREGVQP